MINLSCHCGQVYLSLEHTPETIHACNCSLCRKSGAHWAYADPTKVDVTGGTATYARTDRASPSADLHFCPTCGATTHFTLTAAAVARHGNTMMGVNMLLADESELAGLELRFPDGRQWSGEGPFGYVRPAVLLPATEADA